MKITGILLLVGCLQLGARGLTQTVSISVKDAPLLSVLKAIEKQTDYTFILDNQWLKKTNKVTVTAVNLPLQQVLELCFKDQPLTYEISGRIIIVSPRKEKKVEQKSIIELQPENLLGVVDITGRVTNEFGEPLAGANVVNKRTGSGTITNANGQFTLKNLNNDDIVLVTFVGYDPLSIKVGERTNFTLVMNVANNKLDAAVVQAYGKTTDRLRTGNISRVTSEEISKQPIINPLEALQGKIPGAVLSRNNGYASGTVKFEIRGRNTIDPGFSSDPLYIIDGVPLTILDITNGDSYASGSRGVIQSGVASPASGQSPFFNINPSDIESIEVLKDADATAIYGSRASNGVVLITTKKAKAGKTKFEVNAYSGVSKVIKYYDMLTTAQYVQMRTEALKNDGKAINAQTAPDLVIWDTTHYTDWQKYLWGNTGKTFNANFSLSGGDTRTNFRLGGNFDYRQDILVNSGSNQRGGLSFNFNHKTLNQKLQVGLAGLFTNSFINTINTPGASTLAPNSPGIYSNSGKLNYSGWIPMDFAFPFASLLQPYTSKTSFLTSNLNLKYELIRGLNIGVNFGYNYIVADQKKLTPILSQNPLSNPTGQSAYGYTFIHNLIVEPQMNYDRFVGKGKLEFMVGASYQDNSTRSSVLSGGGISNDININNLGSAQFIFANTTAGEYKYDAIFSRVNYNWSNKYVLNINSRRDGSSKFGPGRQFGNFASVGGAWIFTEEKLVKNKLPFLTFGKFRVSYGTTGGDQISQYAYLTKWAFNSSSRYNGYQTLIPQGHTDSSLHWQVNRKFEAGLTLSFWEDRLNFEASAYVNRCNNQLVSFPTPAFTGFTFVTSNSPANVENKGLELQVNGKLIKLKDFQWSMDFNIGFNRNKLVSYPNFSQSPYAPSLVIGKSLNIVKVLHYTGVDVQKGTYQFEDKNKDGQIKVDNKPELDDRYIVDGSPKYSGGLSTSFVVKNFEFSLFFYFIKQDGRNAYANLSAAGIIRVNQPVEVLKRWQKPGDITTVAKFTTQPNLPYLYYQNSDAAFGDASYLRLQNVFLSYSLPATLIKKYKMTNFKLYFRAQNLFVITKFKGSDPEVKGFGIMPIPKILTAGISLNF